MQCLRVSVLCVWLDPLTSCIAVYGITTGFGKFASVVIPTEDVE